MALSLPLTGCFTLIRTWASSSDPVVIAPTPTPTVVTTTTTVTRPATRPTETTVIVTQPSYDYYRSLDLRAVAAAYAESRSVREFEQLLNSARYMVSNLDLNRDGWIDYLRVMETRQGWTHVLYVQAVLGMNVYQNVCTIVTDVYPSSRYVQIIGDPYIYGKNYYVNPTFSTLPPMYNHMYNNSYSCWSSPYHWDYYPSYYTHPSPVVITHYETYVTTYVTNHHYYKTVQYGNTCQYPNYNQVGAGVSRNDYATSNPTQSFSRNYSVVNASAVSSESTRNNNNLTPAPTRQPSSTGTTTTTSTRQPVSSTTTRTNASSVTPVRTPSNVDRTPNSTTTSSRVQNSGRTTTTVTTVDNNGQATSVRRVQQATTPTTSTRTSATSTRTTPTTTSTTSTRNTNTTNSPRR